MKKALTIILTLILGVGVNMLVEIGLLGLALLVWAYISEALSYVVLVAGAVLFAALLSFLAVKLKKLVNGAAFILCAQLPAVIIWAVSYLMAFSNGGGENLLGSIISAAAMLSALIVWVIIEKKYAERPRKQAYTSELVYEKIERMVERTSLTPERKQI